MAWRAFIFWILIAASAGASARAEVWPLRGEASGDVKIDALAGLGLKVRMESTSTGLVLRAARPGLDLEVLLTPLPDGVWAWKIGRGAVDLTELWPLAREYIGAAAAGWSASGRIEVAGEGALSTEAGPTGEVRVALREGWARSDAQELELSGIELDLATRDLRGEVLPATQSLRIAKISKAGAEVRELKLVFGLGAGRVLEVAAGEAALLGGKVCLRPFSFSLAAPAMTAAADVDGLQLAEVARLMPWLLNTAQGKLRGRVELAWDVAKGLRVRDGGLDIVKADDAAFSLTASPGLLTAPLPPRLSVLPWKWARWVSFNNPAYTPLKAIELGRDGLRIETFQVTFWPDGPSMGRTATIHIVGKPASGKLVREVVMDLNFHGPWSEFLAFGLNNNLGDLRLRFE